MDHFEVNLFPLMVKIEYEFGKRVFDYMFPDPKVDNITRNGISRRQRQDADDSDTDTDIDSVDQSSQTSLASSLSKMSSPRRPLSSSGPTLKRMTSLQAIGEESQKEKDETLSITSRKSNGSDQTRRPSTVKAPSDEKEKTGTGKPDDLTQMLSRASQNITLIYVKVPSTVLCLSYKVFSSSMNFLILGTQRQEH